MMIHMNSPHKSYSVREAMIPVIDKINHYKAIEEDILEYYYIALNDIKNGVSIQELEGFIKELEKTEHFEACAGIKKAINYVKHKTINNLKNGNKNFKTNRK